MFLRVTVVCIDLPRYNFVFVRFWCNRRIRSRPVFPGPAGALKAHFGGSQERICPGLRSNRQRRGVARSEDDGDTRKTIVGRDTDELSAFRRGRGGQKTCLAVAITCVCRETTNGPPWQRGRAPAE